MLLLRGDSTTKKRDLFPARCQARQVAVDHYPGIGGKAWGLGQRLLSDQAIHIPHGAAGVEQTNGGVPFGILGDGLGSGQADRLDADTDIGKQADQPIEGIGRIVAPGIAFVTTERPQAQPLFDFVVGQPDRQRDRGDGKTEGDPAHRAQAQP
ncbi:hypothetical protein Q427_27410 [Halomonas sp. BC04]|nr:hypothetical protein Q427_27410 [Halomonas sp. BC04]